MTGSETTGAVSSAPTLMGRKSDQMPRAIEPGRDGAAEGGPRTGVGPGRERASGRAANGRRAGPRRARARAANGPRLPAPLPLQLEAGPAGRDFLGRDSLDDDQLVPPDRARHQANGAAGDIQFVGQEPDEGGVRCPAHGRRRNPGLQHSLVIHAVDSIGPASGRQAYSESDLGAARSIGETEIGFHRRPIMVAFQKAALDRPIIPPAGPLAAAAPYPAGRAPNRARPTRMTVAPSSTATG